MDHNPWLDLLRSLAITLVFLRHGHRGLEQQSSAHSDAFGNLLANGWIGVDLFFVLSGYLICRHLLRSGYSAQEFLPRDYLLRRALRIVPAYFAALALVLAGAFPGYRFSDEALPFRVVYHLLFMQDYYPADINVVFWSLGVEEKFYLVAPLALAFIAWLGRTRYVVALLLCVLVSPGLARMMVYLAHEGPWTYEAFFASLRSPFHASLEPLAIGVAIAWICCRGTSRLTARAAGTLMATTLAVSLWLLSKWELMAAIDLFDAGPQPLLIAIACGLLVFCAAQLASSALPGTAVWSWLARMSYTIYLVHFPLLPLALWVSAKTAFPALAFWGVYAATTLFYALVLHHLIERPFLRLKDQRCANGHADGPRHAGQPAQ